MSYGLDKNTIGLFHFDKDYKDYMGNPFTKFGAVEPTISQSIYKFRRGSLYTAGNSGLVCTDNKFADFGNSDFSIDCQIYTDSFSSGINGIVCKNDGSVAGNAAFYIGLTNGYLLGGIIKGTTGANWIYVQDTEKISLKKFIHIMFVRMGSSIYLFKDGNLIGTKSGVIGMNSNTVNFSIGCFNYASAPYYFDGYIDELRISSCARKTSPFSPPTFPYVDYDCLSYADRVEYLYGYK